MKKRFCISIPIYALLYFLLSNSYFHIARQPAWLFGWIPLFLTVNALPGLFRVPTKSTRLKLCYHGALLLAFFTVSALLSVIAHGILAFSLMPADPGAFLWSALFCIGAHLLLFWNGILCVYLTSVQLGIKQRVIGALCGMIPIANLLILNRIIRTTFREALFESQKEALNDARKAQKICATKYPLLLVHGVFFRDADYFNYWGRIPAELKRNGAKIFYGNHQSAAAIADSAQELAARIRGILAETGAEKVNIIAHSKGGLDCRYAIGKLGMGPYIASLTTVNTPHIGCIFADYLLHVIPEKIKNKVADTYNTTLTKLGDDSPDFLAAVNDLTASRCAGLNRDLPVPQGIYCQSIGSVMPKSKSGKFPMNLAYPLVKHFDGENDGLVAERAFPWGEKYTLLKPTGKRGISHGDVIDLNRENIDGFDVREFYVNLVAELKEKGL